MPYPDGMRDYMLDGYDDPEGDTLAGDVQAKRKALYAAIEHVIKAARELDDAADDARSYFQQWDMDPDERLGSCDLSDRFDELDDNILRIIAEEPGEQTDRAGRVLAGWCAQ